MKQILLLLTFAAFCCSAADNLIPAPFKRWSNRERGKVSFEKGIVTITANTDPKVNGYQKTQVELPFSKEMRGKKFELSFKYRTEKLNGAMQIAVRQAFAKGGSYHGLVLKKWDITKDWKEFRHTFTVRNDARRLMLYLVGSYMKAGEKVELKDLKVIAK